MRSLILLLTFGIAACATMGAGSGITIETAAKGQAMPGVACTVWADSGSWNIVTPTTLHVDSRHAGDLRVICDQPGYRTSEFVFTPLGRYGSGSSIGIGLGGGGDHVGFGVGLSMPIQLGSGGYPTKVTIDMHPK